MDAVLPLLIDSAIVLVPGVQATAGRSQDDPRPQAKRALKMQARLLNRLLGGQQGELGELVIEQDLLAVEIGLGRPVVDLSADLDRQAIDIAKIQLRDPAATLAERLQGGGNIVAKRVKRSLNNIVASFAKFFEETL